MAIQEKYLCPASFQDFFELTKALEKRQLAGTADVVRHYEDVLSSIFGVSSCVAVSSGSAALHAALVACGVKAGDEVLVPGIAPIPTILPVLAVGATPIFVDTQNPRSISIDVESIEDSITKKTKAAIFLPLWGYSADCQDAVTLCRSFGIKTIEDAAQSFLTVEAGINVGTIADFGCFSTHDRKLLSTGEGGFVLCRDPESAERIRRFTRLGGMKGQEYGPNYKISGLQAALGISRIHSAQQQISSRTETASKILEKISNRYWSELETSVGSKPNYYLLALYPNFGEAHEIQLQLQKLGISTDFNTYGAAQYRKELFRASDLELPNSIECVTSCATIPVHPEITDDAITLIAQALNTIAQRFS
ncbi:DegT/DnrJ/EryC1/StrS family aminotransferase [Pseudomonas syringae]|uniref:DegT/DnrJ/EryC1/StrS family aminotransferase n=1 Tax=Pseudomonas syringae TaxID=317 RepID=UPI003F74CBC0